MGDPSNDAIVALRSQLGGANAGHSQWFLGLSHTNVPETVADVLAPFGYSNANVLDSSDVDLLVACWLSRSGDSGCLGGGAGKMTPVDAPQVAQTPLFGNNNIDNLYEVDRLTVHLPTGLELGAPFDLAVDVGDNGLPKLQVVQSSETGRQKTLPAIIAGVNGRTAHLNVTPAFFGATRFHVLALYPDGGIDFNDFTTTVSLPSKAPTEFHADALPVTGTWLDLSNPSVRLHPWAIYSNMAGRVYLDARYVSYSVAPAAGPPVVRLDPSSGIVYGLRPGTATIIGRFGDLTDQVRVTVKADANH